MVGKRVKLLTDTDKSFVQATEATITSYQAERYFFDGAISVSKFLGHEEGLTIKADNGNEMWTFIEDVEVIE